MIRTRIYLSLIIYFLKKPLLKNVGLGRIGRLKEPMKIREVVDKMKNHLGMKTFRLALANGKTLGIFLVYIYFRMYIKEK